VLKEEGGELFDDSALKQFRNNRKGWKRADIGGMVKDWEPQLLKNGREKGILKARRKGTAVE
jgi:hypothetical protein